MLSDLPALGGGLDDEGSDVGDVVVRETAAEGGHGTLAVGDLGHDGLLVEATGEELQRDFRQNHVHPLGAEKGGDEEARLGYCFRVITNAGSNSRPGKMLFCNFLLPAAIAVELLKAQAAPFAAEKG